jgi:glycine C-acetyltransferase
MLRLGFGWHGRPRTCHRQWTQHPLSSEHAVVLTFRSALPMTPLRRSHRQRYQEHYAQLLQGIKEANTYKRERTIISRQGAHIRIRDQSGAERDVLNFCANNYLGLSDHSELIDEAIATLKQRGLGLSSVRFICGTQDIHTRLEHKIASFHRTEGAILFGSCFDANAGVFEALLGPEDALFSDALNHASIIDGIRLCKAQKHIYKHLDMNDLERLLQEANAQSPPPRIKLIVTDGAFSMDGEVAPLDRIAALAQKYEAMVFIDECHATGFIGATGRGTPEHFGAAVERSLHDVGLIINSTLGKALGGATGGYTTGPQWIVDTLRQRARPYLFSNSIAPPIIGAALRTYDMLLSGSLLPRKRRLDANTALFRTQMTRAGFTVRGVSFHPIVPIMLGDAGLANKMAELMLDEGIYVIGFSFPVVPRGEARIRVQLSAAHDTADVEKCVAAFIKVGKQLGVIPK